MAAQETDVLVIGGGLVGLSTAMHLKAMHPDLSITLIEKDGQLAGQQSGHNSGVLHAGIYYEPGSLKAEFCVEGNAAMVEFCVQHGIPVVRCGKVIVANTDEEIDRLERLHDRGFARPLGSPDDRADRTGRRPLCALLVTTPRRQGGRGHETDGQDEKTSAHPIEDARIVRLIPGSRILRGTWPGMSARCAAPTPLRRRRTR